ncbi:MAG TPA: DUF5995 family protein [Egibacteraceae bacterium]|nr:DUF5995 family protein [Egibacteraceae bacterium]
MATRVRRQSFSVLTLDGWLPAAPAAVWPFVSQPQRLNRWSSAPVRGLEEGDSGGFGSVGALRQVVLPRPLAPVTEAVQYADAPFRFVYRAVGSRSVRYHRGEIRLLPEGAGTRLCWELGMALVAPGATAFVRRTLAPQLEESIRRLASVVGDASQDAEAAGAHSTLAFRDDDDPAAADAAQATAGRLRALADAMEAGGDARHWFSRVYQYVTEAMIEACARGDVAHPTWTLRLIPRFHDLYVRSVDGSAEPHWQEAFEAIDAAGSATASGALPFWRALVAGARAHIEGDLPRVLAATYADHYRHRCDYARFRADFLLLATPLQAAWHRLAGEVPPRWFPAHLRMLDRVLPAEATEHLTAKRFFDPLIARRTAFENGRAIATAGPPPGRPAGHDRGGDGP